MIMMMDMTATVVIMNCSVAVEEEGRRWREERGRRKRTSGCFLEMLTLSFLILADVEKLFRLFEKYKIHKIKGMSI